jgi:hypothetical protein
MEVKSMEDQYPLSNKWNFYSHLHGDKDWSLDSYTKIATFQKVDDVVFTMNELTKDMFMNFMFFMMKDGILPLYEFPENIKGGHFSFKISSENVIEVFKNVCYAMCGGTILSTTMIKAEKMDLYLSHINGLSISPKKGFFILKIWLNTRSLQNASIINVPKLPTKSVLFLTK